MIKIDTFDKKNNFFSARRSLKLNLNDYGRNISIIMINQGISMKLLTGNSNKNLSKKIAKNLGIGNSTGLGMAPFIVNHPTLLHQWIYNREKALKEIRSIKDVRKKEIEHFKFCLEKSKNRFPRPPRHILTIFWLGKARRKIL